MFQNIFSPNNWKKFLEIFNILEFYIKNTFLFEIQIFLFCNMTTDTDYLFHKFCYIKFKRTNEKSLMSPAWYSCYQDWLIHEVLYTCIE